MAGAAGREEDEAAAAENAEAQAEELMVLQEIFGGDCRVEHEEPGRIELALDVFVDLGLAEGQDVRIVAEAPPDADLSAGAGAGGTGGAADGGGGDDEASPQRAAAGAERRAAAAEAVQELIRQRILGGGRAPQVAAPPRLERSASRRRAEASVRHLPPITLHVSFPATYPGAGPPDFHLVSAWLSSEQLSRLCASLDEQAEGMPGSPIVFVWAEYLRNDTAALLGLGGDAALTLSASGEATDVRAVADCVDPAASLLELLRYNQQTELILWRKQTHTCNICFSEKAGTQFVQLGGCDHAFCADCMAEMSNLHVREGSILELKCPLPDCRAEVAASMLGQVLDEATFERWLRLKFEQVVTSEMDDVAFCPRCEENNRNSPAMVLDPPASEEDAPIATCPHCEYMFCTKCLGVAHGKIADCISEEDRMMQVAMRRLDNSQQTFAEKRKNKRMQAGGKLYEVLSSEDAVPSVDVTGCVSQEEVGPMKEGDEIVSVSLGTRDNYKPLWTRREHSIAALEEALASRPPLVIRFRPPAGGERDRQRKKRMLEELMTLRAIKQDSQPCPKCGVRIMRSQGCNHMRCTHCDAHFCYRCGRPIPSDNPYSHFSASGCPTFDQSEVRRVAEEQARGGPGEDRELEELRRQFGRQEDLFAHFQEHGHAQRPRIARRERHANDTPCPTCRQWNARNGRLNHARCFACRTSYCHHCGRRIEGAVPRHYQGEGACPQHNTT